MIRPGDRLGSFAITAALGAGGMGAVFSAIDERLQRSVAIKVLHAQDSEEARLRLVREARTAASLDHPGLVHIFELGDYEGLTYVVMELVRGRTLSELLAMLGPPPPAAVAAAGEAIARATAAAHDAGIVHRDIKPRNVMLKQDGRVKVLDFGLAKPMAGDPGGKITVSGAINGTPLYLAPELLEGGQPTALSDIWALGITLAELASGVLPFSTNSLPQLFKAIAQSAPNLGAVAPELRSVVEEALAKPPERRPRSMHALALLLAPHADPEALRAWAEPAIRGKVEAASSRRAVPATRAEEADTTPAVPPVSTRAMAATRIDSKPPPQPQHESPAGRPSTPPVSAEPRSAAPGTRPAGPRSARALDEGALDDLAARTASLPEPIAALAVGVEVARAEGDSTGVRKRLFELGIGVVRYGAALGLAVLAARLGSATAPKPIADALGRAARLSDGQWCDLTRKVASALKGVDGAMSKLLGFAAQKPLAELVSARNDFIHGGGSGDAALVAATAVLDGAEALLAIPLRVVLGVNPPSFEARVGTPVRAGVWRRTSGAVPPAAVPGAAYASFGANASTAGSASKSDWTEVSPWLPLVEKRLLLMDSPHAAGKLWRWSDPETGEHREHPPLDEAVRRLVGSDPNAPRELTDRPVLVGRSAAVRALQRAAEEASQGGVRVVALTGPFGIGRTRLAHALVEAAAGFGFGRVIEATCSAERRSPLRPLRRAMESAAEPGLARVGQAIGRALALDPVATRAAFDAGIEAIEEALVETSLEEPMVLAVDDAQWADEQTLAVLRLLTERATRKANGKLVVVVTVRDEPNPSAALRRFIGQVEQDVGSGATRMPLLPIVREDARKLVQGVAPIDPHLERVTVEGAGGVPFFLVQPLLVWNETGALEWRDAAWRPRDATMLSATPPGVRDLVRARLGSYFDAGSDAERAAHHVLACVALYGTGLSMERLVTAAGAAGTSAVAAEHALEALAEAGLLVVQGDAQEHGFAQGMVRQAVLEDLKTRAWFRRIHRALLDAVAAAEDTDDAVFLANGFEALGAKDDAASWLRRAVDAALATGSFDAAIDLGERLAKSGRDSAERAHAEISVVDALVRAGRAPEAQDRLEAVSVAGATDPLVDLGVRVQRLAIGGLLKSLPPDHDPTLVADADASGEVRLRVEARLAASRLVRGAAGLAHAEEAVKLVGSAAPELRYRALAMQLERFPEVPGIAADLQRRVAGLAAEVATELGSSWATLDAEQFLAGAEVQAGRAQAAVSRFAEIAAGAERLKYGTLRREALINAATASLRARQVEPALPLADAAATACRAAGDVRLLASAQSVRAQILMELGRLSEAREAIDETIELTRVARDYTATLALLRRTEILTQLGEYEGAAADAEAASREAISARNVDHGARASLWRALIRVRAGAPGAADELRAAVAEVEARSGLIAAPTRRLLEDAKKALD